MRYSKPALNFRQQAQRLLERGLVAPDIEQLTEQLSIVNYYRLSAYWNPFKQIDPNTGKERFAPNTTFETIWRRYTFDRQLRLLVMETIELVEVAILRTRMVEQFTLLHGPFGYCDPLNFNPTFDPDLYNRMLSELNDAVRRSKEEFVGRFQRKYTGEKHLPLWMAVEVMTFGQLYTFFHHMHHTEQQKLALQFNLYPKVLNSWLHTLNFIRNACAHHARLWNREIPIRPLVPKIQRNPEWHDPVSFDNRRVFMVLTLLIYLLGTIDPRSDWQARLEELLNVYPEIPLRMMGFPENWHDCPIWQQTP
jgi:abortive infection bacteriophage resistance protein